MGRTNTYLERDLLGVSRGVRHCPKIDGEAVTDEAVDDDLEVAERAALLRHSNQPQLRVDTFDPSESEEDERLDSESSSSL